MIKFLLDKLVSIIILILISPILITIACINFLVDGFPITFSSRRVGYKNNKFTIYKFRSMKNSSSEVLGKWGSFIRRTNLDELLQFLM